MHLRCSTCHGSVWIETHSDEVERDSVCGSCGQSYHLAAGLLKRWGGEAFYRKARLFAREESIDMPASLSVLLGLMTLEQVRDTSRVPGRQGPNAETGSDASDAPRFDRSFEEAVTQGWLTPRQAFQRGKRETYANRIIERHQLPDDLAYAVADNRITLLAAIRQRASTNPITVDLAKPTRPDWSRTLLTGSLVIVFLSGISAIMFKRGEVRDTAQPTLAAQGLVVPSPEPPQPPTKVQSSLMSATRIETDSENRPTRVTGPDPRVVLDVFCQAGGETARVPLRVAPSVPPSPEQRWGLFENASKPGEVQVLAIRRDRQSRLWVAGDGSRPISGSAAPPLVAADFSP